MGLFHLLSSLTRLVTPNNTKFKGKVGESLVSNSLRSKFFCDVDHRLIDNLIIKDEKGYTHQIDHIEIRANGIFCIETKNYSGYIFGSVNQEKWTQCLYNKKHNYFYNPIKQNTVHIENIRRVLNYKYKVNSIIVFIKNNANNIKIDNVINLSQLPAYLNNYNDGINYSSEEMDFIFKTLVSSHANISEEEHIKNVKSRLDK